MKIRYIPAGVVLLAGAITCLICIMRGYEVIYSLEVLLLVLLIFTFIGMKSQQIIINVMHEQKEMEEELARKAEYLESENLRKRQEEDEEDGEIENGEREEETLE